MRLMMLLQVLLVAHIYASEAAAQTLDHDFSRAEWDPASSRQQELVLSASPIDGRQVGGDIVVEQIRLPFYQNDVRLLRVRDPQEEGEAFFLESRGALTRLTGKSDPIHRFNARSTFSWSVENAARYLWFFAFFVRGEHGPFFVVDGTQSGFLPNLFGSSVSAADARALQQHARPPSCLAASSGGYACNATFIYGANLFEAAFKVHRNGMVEMLSDTPLAGLGFSVAAPIKISGPQVARPMIPPAPTVSRQCVSLTARSNAQKGRMAGLVATNPGVHAIAAGCGALALGVGQESGDGAGAATFLACAAVTCWSLEMDNCVGVAGEWLEIYSETESIKGEIASHGC